MVHPDREWSHGREGATTTESRRTLSTNKKETIDSTAPSKGSTCRDFTYSFRPRTASSTNDFTRLFSCRFYGTGTSDRVSWRGSPFSFGSSPSTSSSTVSSSDTSGVFPNKGSVPKAHVSQYVWVRPTPTHRTILRGVPLTIQGSRHNQGIGSGELSGE